MRVVEVAGSGRPHLVCKAEIGAAALVVLHRGYALLARAHNAEARRQHEALLRAGYGEIAAPLVHAEVDASDRAHAVDVEKLRMARGIDGAPHRGDIAGDAGRC